METQGNEQQRLENARKKVVLQIHHNMDWHLWQNDHDLQQAHRDANTKELWHIIAKCIERGIIDTLNIEKNKRQLKMAWQTTHYEDQG